MTLGERLRRRFVLPVVGLLKQGLSPDELGLCLAWGVLLGIFPIVGTTTLLCALAAVTFRMNLVAIQVTNYAVYPLQIVLLIPFVRIGDALFAQPSLPLSYSQIAEMTSAKPLQLFDLFGTAISHAVVAWLLVAPLVLFLLPRGFAPLLRRLSSRHLGQRLESGCSRDAAPTRSQQSGR